jgi:hypothetical protein
VLALVFFDAHAAPKKPAPQRGVKVHVIEIPCTNDAPVKMPSMSISLPASLPSPQTIPAQQENPTDFRKKDAPESVSPWVSKEPPAYSYP